MSLSSTLPNARVRENRMHGLMREGRREPVLYSTQLSFSATLQFFFPACLMTVTKFRH